MSEFKKTRTEGFFKSHGGVVYVSIGELKMDEVIELREYLDLDTGAVVRTERYVNGVLQSDGEA